MTPRRQPTAEADVVGLALSRMNRPGTNDRQHPSRRVQMTNAAAYAVQVLEAAAAGDVDPDALRLAAEGLTVACSRLNQPKPRRQSLPRPGRITEAGRDVSLEQMQAATDAARALTVAFRR